MLPQEGLPAGTVAPAFELPELRGGQMSLEQFRGRRVLLVFSGPNCIYCERMMPDLAALPLDGRDGRPVPLVISSGTLEDNLAFFKKFGVRCSVLLTDLPDLPTEYKAWSTPSGYLIDEEGTIISELAIGGDPLMELATNPKSGLIKTGENVTFLGMPKPPGS
jgi:peroxiredoxin